MFILRSSGIKDKERMPANYANIGVQGGENTSPPFEWEGAPEGTKSFALAMVDHHEAANEFVHWLIVNIPAKVDFIQEDASRNNRMPIGSRELHTSYGDAVYGGPRPPAGSGDHPYETTIYALNVDLLELSEDVTIDEFLQSLEGKVLAEASLTGMFSQ